MWIKFENADVKVWKLRKGIVVLWGNDYCHLKSIRGIDYQNDGRVTASLLIEDGYQDYNVSSKNLVWLED